MLIEKVLILKDSIGSIEIIIFEFGTYNDLIWCIYANVGNDSELLLMFTACLNAY